MELRITSPFPGWALPQAWEWLVARHAEICDDYDPRSLDEWLAWWGEGRRSWGVYRDDELGGLVLAEAVNPDVAACRFVFKQTFWGRAVAVPALRQVFAALFEAGASKVTMLIFADNYAVRELALAAGAVEETHRKHPLRAVTRRGGELVDGRILSLFKEGKVCRSGAL